MQAEISQYFSSTTSLARSCNQNGWIDEDSLVVKLLEQQRNESVFEARFEEILKEGSGCDYGRNDCWGKIKLTQLVTGKSH